MMADHTKRCQCKLTNCSYNKCSCYGSGIYCDVGCHCQECINREQNDGILAMYPVEIPEDVVKDAIETGKTITRDVAGNSSGQRVGCSCTKMHCENGRCKCLKGKVECSLSACRCEGCENRYGRRALPARKRWTFTNNRNKKI